MLGLGELSPIIVFIYFFVILTATLLGVYIAFLLDGWHKDKRTRQTAVKHLKAIESEIQLNDERIDGNQRLINKLQKGRMKGDHYVLTPLEMDAWRASQEEPLAGTIENELYDLLREYYAEAKAINSLVDRQKWEIYHSQLQESTGDRDVRELYWSLPVDYFDQDNDTRDSLALGVLITEKARGIESPDDTCELLDQQIETLSDYSITQYIRDKIT